MDTENSHARGYTEKRKRKGLEGSAFGREPRGHNNIGFLTTATGIPGFNFKT